MQLSRLAPLALIPAALAAQAPVSSAQAPAAAPAAQPAPAPAPSLSNQYRSAKPAIEALAKEDPAAALAKAEALIPATAPAFDKTNPQTVAKSVNDGNALVAIYKLNASVASTAGEWEKCKDYAQKAQQSAKDLAAAAEGPMTDYMKLWQGAVDKSKAALDDEKVLDAKTTRTPEEQKTLDGYKANEATNQFNVAKGPGQVASTQSNLKNLKDQPGDFDAYIASVDGRIKSEAADIAKFDGDKAKYVASAAKQFMKLDDKEQALSLMRRLHVLAPDNKHVAGHIAFLSGKGPDVPEPAEKPATAPKHHKKSAN